ncbi:phage tail tape measure protein [Nocardia tengchongensis]|uniref:phage tail tape measure protein n=1 Tax=Nocardia tengchongensis TaxID=2055889 RepID=UPI0036840573
MKGVWFDILPRMVGMQAETEKIVVESEKAGQKAGKAFSGMFDRETASGTSKTAAAMTAQVNTATTVLEQASTRAVQAHDRSADAAGRVRIAEQKLAEARTRYAEGSLPLIKAEEGLAKAKRDTATASGIAETAATQEARALETLAAKQDALATSSGGMSTALKTAATIGVGALVVGTGEAIKSAADFQETQTRLVTTAGLSKDSLDTVSQGILGLAGQVGYSAQDLSKAMYTVSSGMTHVADPAQDAANALMILKAGAQGAAQEGAPLKEVVDATTTALKDYARPASESAEITGKMIAAVSHGKTTFAEFTTALGQVQAGAAAANVPMDDLYASLAQMTTHGIGAEQAAQNLNRSITTLQKPSQQMTTALSNIGINANDLAGDLGTKGLSGTLNEISEAIVNHLGPDHKVLIDAFSQNKVAAADANRAFAEMAPNLQNIATSFHNGSMTVGDYHKALKDLAPLQADQLDHWATLDKKASGFNETLEKAKNTDLTYQQMLIQATGNQETARVATNLSGADNQADINATKKAEAGAGPDAAGNVQGWTEVQGNFNQKLRETKASLGATAIEIGTDLLPAATKFLGYLKDGAEWLDKHKAAADGVVATIGTLAAAWGTIKVAQGVWGGLNTVIGGVKGTIGGVAKGAEAGANMISSAANGARRLSLMAQGWWEWTGQARAAATKDFVATKVSAGVEAVQSGAAWVAQGARAAGAWVVMQAKAVGAFLATKASAVLSAGETAAAWVAQNAKVVASFVLVEGASIAAGVAEKGMAAAQWLLNAAMDANPIGLLIVGIGALVGGVVYAYNHFEWFRDIVQDVWGWMKKAGQWIGHEFMDIWHKAGDFIHDNSEKISNAGHAVGEAFQWGAKVAIEAWHDLEKGLGEPTYLVMRYVYQDGIRKMWDSASDVVGGAIGHLPDLSNEIERIPHFRDGGVYSGPGIVRQGSGWPHDDVNAKLSTGEGVAVPGFVQWFGEENWHRANRHFSGLGGADGFHFAPGGIFSAASHPVEWLRTKLTDAVHGAESLIGGDSMWTKLLFQLPEHMIAKLIDWGADKLGSVAHGAKSLIGDVGHVLGFARGGIYSDEHRPLHEWWSTGDPSSAPVPPSTAGGSDGPPPSASALTSLMSETPSTAVMTPGQWTTRQSPGSLGGSVWSGASESGGGASVKSATEKAGGMSAPASALTSLMSGAPQTAMTDDPSLSAPGASDDAAVTADLGPSDLGPSDLWPSADVAVTADLTPSPDVITSADPSASATAGTGSGAASGLQVALDAIRDHLSTMYKWGGIDLSSGVDCSGLVGDAQLLATGQQPDHRVGTTDTMMSGGWPGMIKGANRDDYFVAGVNDHHMAGSILGTPFEARQKGESLRMGSSAASPFDTQFVEQWHLDPTLINPAYQPGLSGDPLTGASPTDKAGRYKEAAQKELDLAKKHDAEAEKFLTEAAKYKEGLPAEKQKHLDEVKRHLDAAAEADKLASFTTGAEQQKHLDAAKHDRDLAQKAQDAAGNVGGKAQKYLDAAAKARQMAADERKRAKEDLEKADKAATSSGKKGDGDGGWMTFKQFNEHAADVATDFITDSTGMPSWMSDPNQSRVLRIGKQLTNIRPKGETWTAPNWGASPFLPSQKTDEDLSELLPATHDVGGPIPPGLSLVNNKTGGDEVLVINPQLMGQRQPEPVGAPRGRGGERSGPVVSIGTWVAASGDQSEANRLGRTVGQYARLR